ncbi:MAG: imidazole glycerol phosphate synthase subunit HisH [Cellvibrionales bacterium]|jgi:imidazole glycerol-phosphate synthase subunit HisH|nr:imidazole glycerol phosphate synthase subunit HisH [Cellvibrionales bacterium]MCH9842684.1 imidazole glycerol phosphate synthase subunit HisH [Gammaproteobacteria bacterium]MDC0887719.1 imidazole glycerol phosphate synthase subunit HisH [Porticoccus sp.]MDC1093576.1 imidazole glycerol phosphate synthase subunit HisH [Porticoccus sp.]
MSRYDQLIAVLDYGMGNLHSVSKALERVAPKAKVIITQDQNEIIDADRLVFPGVGGMKDCMSNLKSLGFDKLIIEAITEKPVLGICLGMQALLQSSEENNGIDCLGVFQGNAKFFGHKIKNETSERLKVPHMGWNQVHQAVDHPMWYAIDQNAHFYFVHSYFAANSSIKTIIGNTDYSINFASALAIRNLFAVQFHPEKSHSAGLQLLENFIRWDGS